MLIDQDIDILADSYDGLSAAEIAEKHALCRQGVYVVFNRIKHSTGYVKPREKVCKPDILQTGEELKPVFRAMYAGCRAVEAGKIAGISGADAERAWQYGLRMKRRIPETWKLKNVVLWLNRNDLSAGELADRLGMNRDFLRRILKGQNRLSTKNAGKIAEFTGLSVSEVYGENEEEKHAAG